MFIASLKVLEPTTFAAMPFINQVKKRGCFKLKNINLILTSLEMFSASLKVLEPTTFAAMPFINQVKKLSCFKLNKTCLGRFQDCGRGKN
jgi:hypothetical protein